MGNCGDVFVSGWRSAWCPGYLEIQMVFVFWGLRDWMIKVRGRDINLLLLQTWVSFVWTALYVGLLVRRIGRRKLQYGKPELSFLSLPLSALLNSPSPPPKLGILNIKILEWLEILMTCSLRRSLVREGGLCMCGDYSKTGLCQFLLGQWYTIQTLSWLTFCLC